MAETVSVVVRPCPECMATLVIGEHGKPQGRVVLSGLETRYITAHTEACATKTEDHPLPLGPFPWGAGKFLETKETP